MATYAVGDIQGCYSELEQLLQLINFNQRTDQIWFVGDLVNRGPQSFETIKFVKSLGDSAISVLGNHDVHLIACHAGIQNCKAQSSLIQILDSPDADNIIDWLRKQPLLHHDETLNWTMVHAGFLPQWDLALAKTCANEVEQQLQGDNYIGFLKHAYGDTPNQWSDNLSDTDRWRIILNTFTRIRLCNKQGAMDFEYKGLLGEQASHLSAWFDVPRKSENLRILFGHWSALGLKHTENILALDTGCLWGRQLTAARIDINPIKIYSIECTTKKKITYA